MIHMKNKKPHKIKRILAFIGALLLFAMYAGTLVSALIDHSASQGLLKASIACTIILPVLLYAYTLVYRITRGSGGREDLDPSEEKDRP
jgi:hypothetical protein